MTGPSLPQQSGRGLGRVIASVSFVGPGCWQWCVSSGEGTRQGVTGTREDAYAEARDAAVLLTGKRKP